MIKETGKVTGKLPEQRGEKKSGGEWIKQVIIVDVEFGKNTKQIALEFWGAMIGEVKKINIGDIVDVTYSAKSREYNGNWFTNLNASQINLIESSGNPVDDENDSDMDFEDDYLPF